MKNEITNKLNDNEELRDQVLNLMEAIRNCIEETSPMSSLQDSEVALNNILDDLPVQQQISLYQDSIFELKKELKYKQVLEIEHLENKIKGKLEIIYDLKTQHDTLFKVIKDQTQIIINPPQSESQYQIQIKSKKAKEAKFGFKEQKIIHNALLETIKQQNNAIYTLEDNCMFIRENIEYKKKLSENDQGAFSFEDLGNKANQIELLAHKQEEYYKLALMKQQGAIDSISNEINDLSNKLEEINKENRLNELKMKHSQKKSFDNTNNNNTTNPNNNERIDDFDLNDDNALLTCNLTNLKSLCITQKLFDKIDKSVSMN